MRRPLVAGNWKLNLSPTEATQVAGALRDAVARLEGVDVLLFPTALSIHATIAALDGSRIETGIQNVYSHPSGAYTGANSAVMARSVGCSYALAGHSERRHVFGETDESVGASVRATLDAGLLPVLCVGETLEERDAGRIEEVVSRQLTTGLAGLPADRVSTVTLAYEPVWAIGTGRTASREQAQDVHALIRGWLRERYPGYVGDQMRILYGGSVKPHNAAELMASPDIDGVLVGGASLKADSFAAIVGAAVV
jgi:triosephosphate isomerase